MSLCLVRLSAWLLLVAVQDVEAGRIDGETPEAFDRVRRERMRRLFHLLDGHVQMQTAEAFATAQIRQANRTAAAWAIVRQSRDQANQEERMGQPLHTSSPKHGAKPGTVSRYPAAAAVPAPGTTATSSDSPASVPSDTAPLPPAFGQTEPDRPLRPTPNVASATTITTTAQVYENFDDLPLLPPKPHLRLPVLVSDLDTIEEVEEPLATPVSRRTLQPRTSPIRSQKPPTYRTPPLPPVLVAKKKKRPIPQPRLDGKKRSISLPTPAQRSVSPDVIDACALLSVSGPSRILIPSAPTSIEQSAILSRSAPDLRDLSQTVVPQLRAVRSDESGKKKQRSRLKKVTKSLFPKKNDSLKKWFRSLFAKVESSPRPRIASLHTESTLVQINSAPDILYSLALESASPSNAPPTTPATPDAPNPARTNDTDLPPTPPTVCLMNNYYESLGARPKRDTQTESDRTEQKKKLTKTDIKEIAKKGAMNSRPPQKLASSASLSASPTFSRRSEKAKGKEKEEKKKVGGNRHSMMLRARSKSSNK